MTPGKLSVMPKTTAKPKPPKDDLRYEPTRVELEEDVRIDTTPEELAAAIFGRHPRRRYPLTAGRTGT